MKSYILCCLITFLTFQNLESQVNDFYSNLKSWKELDKSTLPALDNESLKQYYNGDKNLPMRFAEARDIEVSMTRKGNWESNNSGQLVWRHVIESTNALSLNLGFSHFELSGDAELYIYNPSQTDYYGPFTKEDNEVHKQLWSPILDGDIVILELRMSPQYLESCTLILSRINHAFRDIKKSINSESCNLDVICGAAEGWGIVDDYRDIISSVGAYILNGVDQCSGVLINNAMQDCTPYFLTADHCDVTAVSAPSMVVLWNYENSYCRQPGSNESALPGDGPQNQFNSGAIFRSSYPESDFCLVELDDPVDPEYNLHYAGWDLSYDLPDTSICIHHPSVEEKRISFEFDKLDYDPNGLDTSFILVNDWDIGSTEKGSSGAPLFNTQKRVIGQLFGGLASCNNNAYDSYGWIHYSWERGASNNQQLKPWLDPESTGIRFLDGKECGYNIYLEKNFIELCGKDTNSFELGFSASEFFEDIVTYSIESVALPFQASIEFDIGDRSDINKLTVEGLSSLSSGRYNIILRVTDGFHTAKGFVEVVLYADTPNVPSIIFPTDGEASVPINMVIEFNSGFQTENQIQLSTDSLFENVIYDTKTNMNVAEINGLQKATKYFARVRSENLCGTSEWSEISSFTTSATFCTRLKYIGEPATIDPGSVNTASLSISCPYPVISQDINLLDIKGIHSYTADLEFDLEFNQERVRLLANDCDNINFDIGFDDQSDIVDFPCPLNSGSLLKPLEPLSAFSNSVAGGEWILNVNDLYNFDGGEFRDWTLEICFGEAVAPAVVPERNVFNYCEGENLHLDLFINSGGFTDYEVRAFDRNNIRLDVGFVERQKSLNTGELILNLSDFTTQSNSNIRIELVHLSTNNVLALSVITVVPAGSSSPLEINSPLNGQVIHPADFNTVSWTDASAIYYGVQISEDELFADMLIDIKTDQLTFMDIGSFNLPTGNYFIRVYSVQECGTVYSETVAIQLDISNSTTEQYRNRIKIVPNPSSGLFYISMNGEIADDWQFDIFNLSGQKLDVFTKIIGNGIIELDMRQEASGMYYFRGVNNTHSFTVNLIKI